MSEPISESPEQERLKAALRLALVPGVGPRLYGELVAKFGTPELVLAAGPGSLQDVQGVGYKLAREIVASDGRKSEVDGLLQLCDQNQIRLLQREHAQYPPALLETYDPPNILYLQGDLQPTDQLAIAIVGARHATNYGLTQADKLARGLAQAGFTIVSGLARGVDQAAHRGALAAGGRTIAVLGGGLLKVYPPEHLDLARQIQAQGALLSESHPLQEPKGGTFPQRNRIIAGLSLGVIVVEAAFKSGALITAQAAMEQNREVFAVPGRVDSRLSHGCHRLIRDGAKLVETVDDVLEELGPLAQPIKRIDQQVVRHPAELKLNDQESRVLQAIETQPTEIDAIVVKSGLPIARVLSTLSVLEIRRLIRRISGSQVARI
ncbi:MAG: DNA-processing protein DprA [Planctomycetota bacterium]|jgi:DNA processing protein